MNEWLSTSTEVFLSSSPCSGFPLFVNFKPPRIHSLPNHIKIYDIPSPNVPLYFLLPFSSFSFILFLSFSFIFSPSLPLSLSPLLPGAHIHVHPSLVHVQCSAPLRRRHHVKRVRNPRLPPRAILPIQLHVHLPVLIPLQERGAYNQLVGSHAGLVVESVAGACGTKGADHVLACRFANATPPSARMGVMKK